jgi:hypothetical protein
MEKTVIIEIVIHKTISVAVETARSLACFEAIRERRR